MPSILKSTLLSLGLVAGMAFAAEAQSVSSLPPGGGVPAQSAVTAPYGSNQSFYPKPGGNAVWREDHYQAPADYSANAVDHPYSTSIGPKPGAHSSGPEQHYRATAADAAPAGHPYTAEHMGPRPN